MRCFWIPRPRPTALAAAPARTVRRTILAKAAIAAPRAVPALRRTAGLMLVCVAGALPAFELLRPDLTGNPASGAAPAAVASAAPASIHERTTPRVPPPALAWPFDLALLAPPPRPPLPMNLPGVPLSFPPPGGGTAVAGPTPSAATPPAPESWAGPPTPPTESPTEAGPGGGDAFELTGVPPGGTPIPAPGAAPLFLGALGLALLLGRRGRVRPAPARSRGP